MIEIIQIDTSIATLRETHCTAMHLLSAPDNKLREDWEILVGNTNSGVSNLLYNYVTKKYFEKVLKWKNSLLEISDEVVVDIHLSSAEENTLRYVAGFIPYCSSKKYKNCKDHELSKIVMNLISS